MYDMLSATTHKNIPTTACVVNSILNFVFHSNFEYTYVLIIIFQEKQELSSDDESKENENELLQSQPNKTVRISDCNKSKAVVASSPEKGRKSDPSVSLSINCDTPQKTDETKMLQ